MEVVNYRGVSATNPLPVTASVSVSESVLNVTGNTTSAAVLSNFPITNTQGLRSAAVQVVNAGSTCTLIAETSNDGTTWTGIQSILDTTIEVTTPMTTVGLYVFNFTALQFRIRCSVYGSGTPAVNIEFRQVPVTINNRDLLNQINSTLGTPFQVGGSIGNTGFNVTGSLPAGTNVIGHVISDSGSTTAVTQATAANLNATVSIASAQTLTAGSTWVSPLGGSPNNYVLNIPSFIVAIAGYVRFIVKVAKASTTLYIDPKVVVA